MVPRKRAISGFLKKHDPPPTGPIGRSGTFPFVYLESGNRPPASDDPELPTEPILEALYHALVQGLGFFQLFPE